MIFSNIISISSVHIVKSELIKFDLKNTFRILILKYGI